MVPSGEITVSVPPLLSNDAEKLARSTEESTETEYVFSLSPEAHSIRSLCEDALMICADFATSAELRKKGCPPVSVEALM